MFTRRIGRRTAAGQASPLDLRIDHGKSPFIEDFTCVAAIQKSAAGTVATPKLEASNDVIGAVWTDLVTLTGDDLAAFNAGETVFVGLTLPARLRLSVGAVAGGGAASAYLLGEV